MLYVICYMLYVICYMLYVISYIIYLSLHKNIMFLFAIQHPTFQQYPLI